MVDEPTEGTDDLSENRLLATAHETMMKKSQILAILTIVSTSYYRHVPFYFSHVEFGIS